MLLLYQIYSVNFLKYLEKGCPHEPLWKFWPFLGRWVIIISYIIGGIVLLLKGDFYNNGTTDIHYVYFFNISGVLMLGIMAIKMGEKVLKKQKGR